MHRNQKSSCEIVRQGRVRDFIEHMLNSWKDPRDRGTRRNIYFSARFCRSGSNESESLDFLRVLQLGMKSFCTLVSLAPRLCLFAKLFFAVGFTNASFPFLVFFRYLLRSRFYTVYGSARIRPGFSILSREKICMSFNAVE